MDRETEGRILALLDTEARRLAGRSEDDPAWPLARDCAASNVLSELAVEFGESSACQYIRQATLGDGQPLSAAEQRAAVWRYRRNDRASTALMCVAEWLQQGARRERAARLPGTYQR